MSLELGARIVSHLPLCRRTRNFFDLSVPDECVPERDRRTDDGAHDFAPEAQRLLLLHELFLPVSHCQSHSPGQAPTCSSVKTFFPRRSDFCVAILAHKFAVGRIILKTSSFLLMSSSTFTEHKSKSPAPGRSADVLDETRTKHRRVSCPANFFSPPRQNTTILPFKYDECSSRKGDQQMATLGHQ